MNLDCWTLSFSSSSLRFLFSFCFFFCFFFSSVVLIVFLIYCNISFICVMKHWVFRCPSLWHWKHMIFEQCFLKWREEPQYQHFALRFHLYFVFGLVSEINPCTSVSSISTSISSWDSPFSEKASSNWWAWIFLFLCINSCTFLFLYFSFFSWIWFRNTYLISAPSSIFFIFWNI